jgi:hypothetical protein
MRWTRMILGTVGAMLALTPAAHAATFTVTGTVDEAGTCTGELCTSIRAAIDAAEQNGDGGDTIVLAAATYTLVGPDALELNTAVTLRGQGARATTIVAAADARVIEIAGTATISRLTVSGGDAGADVGGNIFSNGTTTLDRVRVTGGTASAGGGVANVFGSMVIENSLIDGNETPLTGSAELTDAAGGGILNFSGPLGSASSLTVRNSTVTRNRAYRGGGIISSGNPQNLVTLLNATVAWNSAAAGGTGGIYNDAGQFVAGSSVVADNAIIAGGSSDCGGTPATSSQGWNVESQDVCGFLHPADLRNVGGAGLSGALQDAGGETDVLVPDTESPVVNLNEENCAAIDQRGVERPQGPACDAGAVELDYAVRIDDGPQGTINESDVTFSFSSAQGADRFECGLSGPSGMTPTYEACTSQHTYDNLADASHTFHVKAFAGTIALGEATRTFTISTGDTTRPDPPVVTEPVHNGIVGAHDIIASGTAEAFSTVEIREGAALLATAETDDSGQWQTDVDGLAEGRHDLTFVAIDEAGNASDPTTVTTTVDTIAPTVTITSIPPSLTNEFNFNIEFVASEPGVTFECEHLRPGSVDPEVSSCTPVWAFRELGDGTHRFEITATDAVGNEGPTARGEVTIDSAVPDPVEASVVDPTTFAFTPAEADAAFECRLEGPAGDSGFVPCTSPKRYPGLVPGDYRFTLRTLDAAGNHADANPRAFSVARPQEAPPTPTPTAAPAPKPAVTPTPAPTPELGETVVVRPVSGRILVRLPGTTTFVELNRANSFPVGIEIDARKGRILLTSDPGNGKPVQRSVFYGGIFTITQSADGFVELKLSEPLAPCAKKKKSARTSAAKPKSRKLWGDGKGKFRTRGQYSAATVRGTKWLVQDSCDGTLTRVANGVVSVRDAVKKKTFLLRGGKSYLAKPKR